MLYDFECSECGHVFEDIQKPDITEIPCEKCQKIAKRKFPVPQKQKEGLTLADGRIRDTMKRNPRSNYKMFDRGNPRQKF